MNLSSSQRLVETCPESISGLQAEIDPRQVIREEAVGSCEQRFGNHLRALILTGSLARNEGSFTPADNGWWLLGDAEFIVILQDSMSIPGAAERHQLCEEISKRCKERGVTALTSLAIAHEAFLRELQPSIFAYELRECGACLTGERDILKLISQFAVVDIPREDAWRMLCNRLIEQLEAVAASDIEGRIISQELFYRTVKLYLDMATSLLLFLGAYEPTYRGRVERLRSLQQSECRVAADFDLDRFAFRVAQCTEWKLSPAAKAILGSEFELWQASLQDASQLMAWQLSQLAGTKGSTQELTKVLMKSEALKSKVRGWAYVARACGWQRSRKYWPRWTKLARQGSPRRLIYAAAIDIHNSLSSLLATSEAKKESKRAWELIEESLPVVSEVAGESHDWRTAVRMCSWNYHHFLENTRS